MKVLKIFLVCALSAALISFVVVKIYEHSQTTIVSQYGPKMTRTGREVTVILEAHGVPDSHKLYVRIKEPDGLVFDTAIVDNYRGADSMHNLFARYVDVVKSGHFENSSSYDW